MPSTYTLNNGIELIATGEQSGTWGDTTNLNLGLVDTALDGQVTVTLPAAGTSGAPNALPISDGAASNGRNRLIIFADGGDLGATAFVQLTPNDAEKIVYIRNNLSGGRAIALFQGTYNAANDYEVPAGTTAVVFFNGGGAGAVAANVFNNAFFDSLRLGGVSVTAILDEDNMASDSATALATQQSIKAYVDAQVGANNELSEVLANGNTSGGTDIQMTTTDEVQFRDTALTIKSSVDGQLDIAADVELEIVAPTLDINASTAVTIDTTTLTMTGSVNVVGDLDVDNLNLNGNTIISTNTDGNIALTPNGTGEVDISKVDIDGGTIDGTVIGGTTPAAISGTTGSFSGNLTVDTNTLFVDAANNRVGIGTSSPDRKLTLSVSPSSATDDGVKVVEGSNNAVLARTGSAYSYKGVGASSTLLYSNNTLSFLADGSSNMTFHNGGNERMRIDSSGNVGIGVVPTTDHNPVVEALQIGSTANLFGRNDAEITTLTSNSYLSLAGYPKYITTNEASEYIQTSGNHIWYNAPSGTAGATCTQTERMRIDASGNVGIGTSSFAYSAAGRGLLEVNGSSSALVGLKIGDVAGGYLFDSGSLVSIGAPAGRSITFDINGERARIDASGNLLVGKTSANSTIAGVQAISDGRLFATVSNDHTLIGNRLSSDGAIATFQKDNTTVGSIASKDGDLAIGTGTVGVRFLDGSSAIVPQNHSTNSGTDGLLDLGVGAARFKDLYLSGGLRGDTTFKNNAGTTEYARFDSSGNLLVGTTGLPVNNGKLSVASSTSQPAARFYQSDLDGSPAVVVDKASTTNTTSQWFLGFTINNQATASGVITANGPSQATFTTWSDARLKENIADLPSQLDKIMALRPVEFDYIESEGGGHQISFIAQEFEGVYPDAIGERPDGMKTLSGWGKTEARLVKALQEAVQKIEALEARITALEA
jgi:hypothetical protein